MRQKKKSLRTKILVLLVLFSLFLGLTISLFSLIMTRNQYNEFYSEKVQLSVRFLAQLIDGDQLEAYIPTFEEAPPFEDEEAQATYYQEIQANAYYQETLDMLKELKKETFYDVELNEDMRLMLEVMNNATSYEEAILTIEAMIDEGELALDKSDIEHNINGLRKKQEILYLYIFYPSEDHFTYIMEGQIPLDDEEKISKIGDTYSYTKTEYDHLVPDILAGRQSEDMVIAGDDFYGQVISAWAPIHNSNGDVVAYVEADVSLKMVIDHLTRYILLTSGLMLLIIVIFVAVLYSRTQRLVIVPINQLNDRMFHYGTGEELQNIENDIFTGDEIQTLSETFTKMVGDIQEYVTNLAVVTAEREKVETELNVAKQIQKSMLPYIFPAFPEREDFDIYAIMNPAKEVGGDFYDFFLIDEDHICFVMADVSGKGIPAALFMMVSKLLIKNLAMSGIPIDEVFEKANNQLNETNDSFMFVTAFIGVLNLKTGDLDYVNAGHNPPLTWRRSKGFEWLEMEKNQILAIMPEAKFVKEHIKFEPGDMIFTYTDGVTEAVNFDHDFYMEPRLFEVLSQIKEPQERSLKEIVMTVRDSIDVFSDGAEQADDITILLLRYMS